MLCISHALSQQFYFIHSSPQRFDGTIHWHRLMVRASAREARVSVMLHSVTFLSSALKLAAVGSKSVSWNILRERGEDGSLTFQAQSPDLSAQPNAPFFYVQNVTLYDYYSVAFVIILSTSAWTFLVLKTPTLQHWHKLYCYYPQDCEKPKYCNEKLSLEIPKLKKKKTLSNMAKRFSQSQGGFPNVSMSSCVHCGVLQHTGLTCPNKTMS